MAVIYNLYRDLVQTHEKDINFWILTSFLPTFIIERVNSHLFPQMFVNVGGVHIHHLTWGIFVLAISGFLSFSAKTRKEKVILAIFFGIGLALAFDEFGMWLRLADDYWVRQSYDAMITISVFLINIVYFFHFWKHLVLHIVLRQKVS